jgi:protein-S-isoprenylcysteine O-methyltransferase Ste14
MTEPILYRALVFVLLLVFVAHRGYYSRKIPPSEVETIDRLGSSPASRAASILFILALLSTLVYIFLPWLLTWAAIPLPAAVRWLGVSLAIAGFGLLEWAQRTLGRNWSDQPRITQTQRLVQNGPYRWVRHPIYSAFLLILGSPLFITLNWLVGLLWIAAISMDAYVRIRYEESAMLRQFGDEYREYQRRTGLLIPGL